MDEKKLKNASCVDADVIAFSEDIVIKSVYCVDGKTLVTLLICGDILVSFTS